MGDYFWMHYSDLPEGVGTANFSTAHLAWLCAVLLFVIAITLVLRKMTRPTTRSIQKVLIFIAVILEIARWTWAAVIGHYSVAEMLPLHLCSLSVWIELIAVFSGQQLLQDFGYALCMPGALAALLTPDWSAYPFFSFQYLQSVTIHSLLFLIPLIWLISERFHPQAKNLPKCFGILMLFAAPVFALNFFLGSNYLFLREAPKGTPLEVFEKVFGNPGYLLPLFLLIFFIWVLLYLPWVISDRISRRRFQLHSMT